MRRQFHFHLEQLDFPVFNQERQFARFLKQGKGTFLRHFIIEKLLASVVMKWLVNCRNQFHNFPADEVWGFFGEHFGETLQHVFYFQGDLFGLIESVNALDLPLLFSNFQAESLGLQKIISHFFVEFILEGFD